MRLSLSLDAPSSRTVSPSLKASRPKSRIGLGTVLDSWEVSLASSQRPRLYQSASPLEKKMLMLTGLRAPPVLTVSLMIGANGFFL
ncbi:hypothetical protein LINPERHAP1_LOCUS38259 [Linum perenne]